MKTTLFIMLVCFANFGFSQSANEAEFKRIVENSFQEIWSNMDESKISKYYTEDFLLLEDGEIWNKDSVKIAIKDIKSRFESPENKAHKFERINKFEYIKSYSDSNSGWIAYHNYADILMNGNSIAKIHWIETAIFIKEKNGWRMNALHSTPFKEEK